MESVTLFKVHVSSVLSGILLTDLSFPLLYSLTAVDFLYTVSLLSYLLYLMYSPALICTCMKYIMSHFPDVSVVWKTIKTTIINMMKTMFDEYEVTQLKIVMQFDPSRPEIKNEHISQLEVVGYLMILCLSLDILFTGRT